MVYPKTAQKKSKTIKQLRNTTNKQQTQNTNV